MLYRLTQNKTIGEACDLNNKPACIPKMDITHNRISIFYIELLHTEKHSFLLLHGGGYEFVNLDIKKILATQQLEQYQSA